MHLLTWRKAQSWCSDPGRGLGSGGLDGGCVTHGKLPGIRTISSPLARSRETLRGAVTPALPGASCSQTSWDPDLPAPTPCLMAVPGTDP